jgi:hypothetical protein
VTDLALSALIRKRAELAAEAKATAAHLDQLRADLVHLDAAIRILCPELAKPRIAIARTLAHAGR